MAQAKTDLDLEEDFVVDAAEQDDADGETPASKSSSLAKRRVIDNLLEKRRLQRQLSEYDYDI